jgi:cystathionine beta-lyase/cystathionine gamma-synthase
MEISASNTFSIRFSSNSVLKQQKLKHIMMAVSWDGHESLILPRCAGLANHDFDAGNAD